VAENANKKQPSEKHQNNCNGENKTINSGVPSSTLKLPKLFGAAKAAAHIREKQFEM
jgi:hypothetical protein